MNKLFTYWTQKNTLSKEQDKIRLPPVHNIFLKNLILKHQIFRLGGRFQALFKKFTVSIIRKSKNFLRSVSQKVNEI